MSFHASAQNIRVDDGHILRATLDNGSGEWVDAEFDLNQAIGNNDGNFEWGGNDFAGSAENISFDIEGDGVPILRAELRDMEGNLQARDLNLAERIGNNGGSFHFE
ncbi:cyanovirin-n family protein [Podospora australis]|uniref:Cyanovirin-n family protein n=1 Tax=Podospora australis TaxID=1536484 RepID=A0AAN7AEU9_9PEZI|nr:cyanovirin-n family protein [Podospora australis]